MLLKLLKYEFKSTGLRFLTSFAVYAVVIGVLLLFSISPNQDLQTLSIFLICLCILGLFIVLFLTLFQRYNTNLYGSDGYLMFTLPVGGKKLLLSKLISAFVWVALYCMVFSLTISLLAVRYGSIVSVSRVFAATWAVRGEMPPYLTAVIVYICFIAMSIYFAITVSKLPVWRNAGVLMGIVACFAANLLLLIPYYVYKQIAWSTTFTENGVVRVVQHAEPAIQSYQVVWIDNAYVLALCIGLFFVTAYLIEKHTSLK